MPIKEASREARKAPDLGAVLTIPFAHWSSPDHLDIGLVTGPEAHKTDYRFPGGGVQKSDPSVRYAAWREADEETGIEDLRIEDFRFVHSWTRYDGSISGPEGHRVSLFAVVCRGKPRVWPSKTGEVLKFFDARTILKEPLFFARHKQIYSDPEVSWRLKKVLSHK